MRRCADCVNARQTAVELTTALARSSTRSPSPIFDSILSAGRQREVRISGTARAVVPYLWTSLPAKVPRVLRQAEQAGEGGNPAYISLSGSRRARTESARPAGTSGNQIRWSVGRALPALSCGSGMVKVTRSARGMPIREL